MNGTVAGLFRHPVKGFTPEPLEAARLEAGMHFPGDRMFAVEDGPSGFDPEAPAHLSKMKFTVLARLPQIAGVCTLYDDASGRIRAEHADHGAINADLGTDDGRAAFAAWLTPVVGDDARGALRVIGPAGGHRFMDSPSGFVSIINLASVRAIAEKLGRPVDPARFRGNVTVDGWPAWSELDLADRTLALGGATVRGVKPISRCTATHVDPETAEADIDMLDALRAHFGHVLCGVYVEVVESGDVAVGDAVAVR